MCDNGKTDSAVSVATIEAFRDRLHVRHEVVVRQHHALQLTSGAGGVDDRGQVVGSDSLNKLQRARTLLSQLAPVLFQLF